MHVKHPLIPPSPSTESLAGAWKIPAQPASPSASSDRGDGSAAADDASPLSLSSPRSAAGPASSSSSGSSPEPSSSGTHRTPFPKPVYALLRLVYSRRELESLFDDSIDADNNAQEQKQQHERAETTAAREGLRQRRTQEQEDGNDNADDDDTAADNPSSTLRPRVRAIREALSDAAEDARQKHPLLLSAQNQDAVGFGILASCAVLLLTLFTAYARNLLPALLVVPLASFLTSLLHELEHDLIHSLYFRGKHLALPFTSSFRLCSAIDAALAVCYVFRPSTINPWARRTLHLNHHRVSGTAADLEERSITNGLKWSPLRLIATGDNLLAILLRPHQTLKEMRAYLRAQPAAVKSDPSARLQMIAVNGLGYAPLGFVHYALWWSFLVISGLALVVGKEPVALLAAVVSPAAASSIWPALRFYAATFGAPQFLRTFCLHLVSSNVHYYSGGSRAPSLVDQTQIVDSPIFWPFQLFCFNFGATHALHHVSPAQPFYLRQACAWDARVQRALKAGGVRFNDLGTFGRANRLPTAAA
jgi:fatty acid desaturase